MSEISTLLLSSTLKNLDGDSSEEDEVIETKTIASAPTSIVERQQDNQASKLVRPVLLQLPDDDDEEEDEDAPLPSSNPLPDQPQESTEPTVAIQSEECVEALQAIESDCWDINSWLLFIDEVEAGRGGTITVPDAYSRFLGKFPRAAKQWKASAEYHSQIQEYALADDVYSKCITKCRSVELWLSYIQLVQLKLPVEGNQKQVEVAFEKAIDNVGMAISSHSLWIAYIDFIKSWPESDPGKKLGE